MTKIEKIYSDLYDGSPEAVQGDNQLSEVIKQKVIEPAGDLSKMDAEEQKELIYAGSSHGQAQGFKAGFRFAISLLFESLVC